MKKLVLLFGLFFISSSSYAQDKAAERYMQNLGDQVVEILGSDSASSEATHERLRSLLESNFALTAMGKFALGKYWRGATPSEKSEFQNLFRLSVIDHYIHRFETHTNERFDVVGSRNEKDGAIVVSSDLMRPSGPPLRLDWRLYRTGGIFKVYDVLLDGISMSITQRSEYSSVIQKEGHGVNGLNKVMQAKWNARGH